MLFVIALASTILTSFSAFSAFGAIERPRLPLLTEQFAAQKTKEIPFYKTKMSIFPSGYANYERLNEQVSVSESYETFTLLKNNLKISPKLVPIVTAYNLSRVWIEKYTKRRIKPNYNLDLATILLNYDLDPFDRGLVLTINSTRLRQSPDIKSAALKTVPSLNYFIPITFEKGFIKVLYNNLIGYIDINDCMSKFDFAKFVISFTEAQQKKSSSSWMAISKREFDNLLSDDHQSIQINQVKGLVVDQKMALTFKQGKDYPLWTSFKIIKDKSTPWVLSQLKGHGHVWWKQPEIEILAKNTLTIDELLKRNVYSASFQPENPKKGLVSADGVYITDDGQNWRPIEQFKHFSGPVHYHSDKLIFIGNYRSLDGGKTFENYVQVDKVSAAITTSTGFEPKKIQITKVKFQKPYNVVIDVKTNTRKIRLKSPLFAQDWTQVKF